MLLAFLLVFLARCLWIDQFGPGLPRWDEWDAELVAMARDGVGKWPPLAELAKPHAEHRILWQRLVARGLVWLNGEWDSPLRNMTNALFAAAYAGLLAGLLARGHTGLRRHLLFWPAVVAIALPLAWENLLFAFQTSFHVLILFTIAAFGGVAGRSFRDLRWWLGLLCGLAAIFTVGSGFFSGPVLLVWATLAFLQRGRSPLGLRLRPLVPTLVAGLLITLAGFALLHRPEGASGMEAQNVGEFVRGLLKHLSWPWADRLWIAPLLWSPLFALAWRILRTPGRGAWGPTARVALCLGGWVLLNLLGMAVFRGAMAVGPVTRYYDFHTLGLVANAAAVVLLVMDGTGPDHRRPRWLARLWSVAWAVVAVWGASSLVDHNFRDDLPEGRRFYDLQARNVFRYVVDKDRSVIESPPPRFHLPYPEADRLAAWLDDPKVLALLPAACRLAPAQAPTRIEGCYTDPGLPPGLETPPGSRLLASSYQEEGIKRGRFLSAPIHATTEWMRFDYLGRETGGNMALRLVPVGEGKAIKISTGDRSSASVWRPFTIRVSPGKDYQVEFSDDSDNAWGALTEPVPVRSWSRRAAWLGAHSLWLLLGTLGTWLVLAAGRAARRSGAEAPAASPAEATPLARDN